MDVRWSPNAGTTGGYAVPLHEPAGTTAQSGPRTRIGARAIAAFVFCIAAVAIGCRFTIWLLAGALDPAATVDIVMDDAYYYLQIAYNLGLHGRSTFDGFTETNGYQPAWMALLAATQAVLQLDKKGLFVALQALVSLLVALPLLYCLRRYREPFFLSLAAGLAAGYATYPHVFSCGMETALFAPAMVAVCAAAHDGLRVSARRVSFLFAGIVMIRLDAACLLLAYALPLAYAWYRAEGARRTLWRLFVFALPATLTLAAFMSWSLSVFGEAAPISGLAKRLGAPLLSNWGIFHYYLLHGTPVIVGGAALLAVELLWSKFEGGGFVYGALGVLSVALSLHYLFFAAFTGWIPWPWYFYVYALMMVLVVARLLDIALALGSEGRARGRTWRLRRWVTPRRAQLAALFAASLPTVFFATYVHLTVTGQMLVNQRRGGVPSGSFNRRNVADALSFAKSREPLTIAMGDRAAGLGYWSPSNVKVFPLEGLVADKAYLDARKRGEGEAWVRANIRPRYLIVDREVLEPVRIGDQERYVVIEPIQGRVVLDHLLTFCFPKDAVVRQTRGRDDQPTAMPAPAVRTTFDMRKAQACTGPFAEHVRRAVFSPESLRRTGVGAEYAPEVGGDVNAAFERFDRRLAVHMRGVLSQAQ